MTHKDGLYCFLQAAEDKHVVPVSHQFFFSSLISIIVLQKSAGVPADHTYIYSINALLGLVSTKKLAVSTLSKTLHLKMLVQR